MFLLEIRLRFLWAPAAARRPGRVATYCLYLRRISHAAARVGRKVRRRSAAERLHLHTCERSLAEKACREECPGWLAGWLGWLGWRAGGLADGRTAVGAAEYTHICDEKCTLSYLTRELLRNWRACRRAIWTQMSGTKKVYRTRMKLYNLLFSEPRTREYFVCLWTTVVFSGVSKFQEIGQSARARNQVKIGKSHLQYDSRI